jgi:hypothetical protein
VFSQGEQNNPSISKEWPEDGEVREERNCKLQIANFQLQIGRAGTTILAIAGPSILQFAIRKLQFAICNSLTTLKKKPPRVASICPL